jgi:hypothetical protein
MVICGTKSLMKILVDIPSAVRFSKSPQIIHNLINYLTFNIVHTKTK